MMRTLSFSRLGFLRANSIGAAAILLGVLGMLRPAEAVILYQDNFNRDNSVNSLGSAMGGIWSLQRDPDNGLGPHDTNASLGADAEIFSNRLLLNSAGQNAGAPVNNNDMLSLYVDADLDAAQQYSVSFKYTHHQAHQYDLAQVGSQANGGFFVLPRAQGNDFPGNLGYVIRTTGTATTSALAVYFYDGTGRSGSPANIPLASLGTALGDTSALLVDQEHSILLDIDGNLATLRINDVVIDENRDIGLNFNNSTADHVLLGFNALGTAQRRLVASVDDLVVDVVPEPGTWALLIAGLAALTPLVRRSRRQDVR